MNVPESLFVQFFHWANKMPALCSMLTLEELQYFRAHNINVRLQLARRARLLRYTKVLEYWRWNKR